MKKNATLDMNIYVEDGISFEASAHSDSPATKRLGW